MARLDFILLDTQNSTDAYTKENAQSPNPRTKQQN
jgi:hypothetical protein